MAVRFRLRVLIWKPSRHLQSSSPERGGSDNQVHQGTFSDAAQRVNAYQTMIAACTEWDTISTRSHKKRYNKAMGFPAIRCEKDIEYIVQEYGFLPFFTSAIPGFSIEEMADRKVWFPPHGEGVWEWKDPVIAGTGAAYGRFFLSRPGFASREFFMKLSAYRRDGYDFEGMVNDGLVTRNERTIHAILEEAGTSSSVFLRQRAGMSKSVFDSTITRLQMRTFMMVSGFGYNLTKDGRPYGWGIARYALPEAVYEELEDTLNALEPADAKDRLLADLRRHFPDADDDALLRTIG